VFIRFAKVLNTDPQRALTAYTSLKNVQEKLRPLVQMPEVLKKIPYKYEDRIKRAVNQVIPEPKGAAEMLKGQQKAVIDELKVMSSDLDIGRANVYQLLSEMETWTGETERFFMYEKARTQVRNFIHAYNIKTDRLSELQKNELARKFISEQKQIVNKLNTNLDTYRQALMSLLTFYNQKLLGLLARNVLPQGWSRSQMQAWQQDINSKLSLLGRKFALAA